MGQLYPAILIARLVSLELMRRGHGQIVHDRRAVAKSGRISRVLVFDAIRWDRITPQRR